MKQTVNFFKALADETRLRILALLLAEGELCVCDLIAALKLPQSTVSRHLAYLRKTGWVNDRRYGLWIYYSIAHRETDLHHDLVALLRRNLAALPVSLSDRAALASSATENRCT